MTPSTESSYTSKRSSLGSTVALACVSLALILQSLAPPGYMAGSVEDGWPVVLCPEGLPAGFLTGHHSHEHEVDSGGHDLSLDGHCPLGGVLDAAVPLPVFALAGSARPAAFNPRSAYQPPFPQRPYQVHPTRAPPAHA